MSRPSGSEKILLIRRRDSEDDTFLKSEAWRIRSVLPKRRNESRVRRQAPDAKGERKTRSENSMTKRVAFLVVDWVKTVLDLNLVEEGFHVMVRCPLKV